MDYPDEHKVEIPEIGKMRTAIKPYIEKLSKDIIAAVPLTNDLNGIQKTLASIQIELMSHKELSKEDVHSIVDKVVSKSIAKRSVAKKASLKDEILKFRPHDQDAGSVYGFYGFVHPSGAYYIVRHEVKASKQRYYVGKGDYEAAWAKRERLKGYGLLSDKWED